MGRLVLVELNEINFDVVQEYLDEEPRQFPALRRLMAGHAIRTTSEERYELLEPWIQWVSVHTGKSFAEHGIFRLGDMAYVDIPQFFEEIEASGLRVGAVSPMNAKNRLQAPAYFLPDPWTATPSDSTWWSRVLSAAISQSVNDNAQARIKLSSALILIMGLLRFARIRNYRTYLRLALGASSAPWRKALFLDLFVHDVHMRLFKRRRPGFSAVFFNAGAHIQHHYFLNAKPLRKRSALVNPDWYVAPQADPIADMLKIYDRIVSDYIGLRDAESIIATGLSQRPYDRVKFYYRLRDHAAFLKLLGIDCKAVLPRMTRDFLIEFHDGEAAGLAQARLAGVTDEKGLPLFGDIDNRGASLFVTLTYPEEVHATLQFVVDGKRYGLAPHVAFVAIKNGMHQQKGFAYFSRGVAKHSPDDEAHVSSLYRTVLGFFGVPTQR